MSSANGTTLLYDGLCSLLGRAGNELVIAEREPDAAGASGACVLRRSSSATKLFKRSVTAFA